MKDIEKSELEKCKNDVKYFIENYCTIDEEFIRLKDYQINLINALKNNGRRKERIRLQQTSYIS